MRTLGLIGGTSWHSTIHYYQNINQSINEHFGNNSNPPLILFNLNHAVIHQHQKENHWDKIAELVIDAGERLQKAGAEALLLCANTTHKVYESVSKTMAIPILHIADATANAIQQQGLRKVCFIGTKFTMMEDFVTNRISKHDIEVITPVGSEKLEELHRIIHQELVLGNIISSSKDFVLNCIQEMVDQGAEGVILGCTEFPILIQATDLNIPIFDTVKVHTKAAFDFILDQ
ncbi:MAG: amino acid racemase [Cytophagales bacterium]|nr:amino acid racemase [Cytophagales bacterium]